MEKKKQLILFFLILFLLAIPFKSAHAIIGTGLFDYFDASLGGAEELSGLSSKIFQYTFFGMMFAYGALMLSTTLLQEAISLPIALYKSPLVLRGWSFVLGLTNLFFILIFIIVAISFILRIKNWGNEKTLTKLITTAVLINFSLLFVGAFADVATFFQNTILGQDFNLVETAMLSLSGGLQQQMESLSGFLIGLLGLYIIPFSAPFAQAAITVRTFTLALLMPSLLTWLTITFVAIGLAGIFFTYFFLFVCRIFVFWALAILSPAAFACRILPDEKQWKEWLKHLTQWTSLGIILLFWLVLGLKMAKYIMPTGPVSIIPISAGWLTIDQSLKYYLFLFVYFCIGLLIQKQTTPELASFLLEQGKALGKQLWGRGIKPVGRALGLGALEAEEMAQRKIDSGEALTRGEWMGRGLGQMLATPTRWAYRLSGTTSKIEREKLLKGTQGKVNSLTDEQLFKLLGGENKLDLVGSYNISNIARNEAILQAAQRGKLKQVITKKLVTKDEIINTQNQLYEKERKADAAIILAQTSEDVIEEAIRSRFPVGMGEVNKLKGEALLLKSPDADDRAEKEYQKLFNETFKGLPDDQVKNINKDLLTSKNGIEWVLSSKGEHLGEIAKSFGMEVIDAIQGAIEKKGELGLFNLAKNNPNLVNFLHSNAAIGLGLGLPPGIEKQYQYRGQEVTADIAEDNRAFQKFMIDARKEAKTEPRIIVTEREKGEKLPKITQSMSTDLRTGIADANKYLSAIQQQRKTLDILVQGVGKVTQQISSLEQKADKTQKETELLKRLNSEIMQKQKEQIRPVSDSLHELEEKFKESQKEIKEKLDEGKKEKQRKDTFQRLEKKTNKK